MRRVALLGPTASGTSAVALALARRRPTVELVSVDAMQVYRGMDIGTAKPSPAERAEIPHHAIDLVDISDEFTVAEFQRTVRAATSSIEALGHDTCFVGGTGLYLRAVVDDLELPGQWLELRAELEQRAERELDIMYRQLAELDPAAAAKIEPTNARRTVRALEVCLGSGRPFSSFGPGLDSYPPSATVQFALDWDREVLARRIEARVHEMMANGFLAEVEQLMSAGPWSRTAAQALGYRELRAHLEGHGSLDHAVGEIVLRTRQFAIRQIRWFRRDPRLRWLHVEADPVEEALPAVLDTFDR